MLQPGFYSTRGGVYVTLDPTEDAILYLHGSMFGPSFILKSHLAFHWNWSVDITGVVINPVHLGEHRSVAIAYCILLMTVYILVSPLFFNSQIYPLLTIIFGSIQ